MADEWKVSQSLPSGATRTLFAGTEEDARAFVENNFPRVHVEPGSGNDPKPDVTLTDPQGTETTFDGVWSDDKEDADDTEPREVGVRPSPNASKAEWVAYALSVEEDASARDWIGRSDTSRADLIAEYGE